MGDKPTLLVSIPNALWGHFYPNAPQMLRE